MWRRKSGPASGRNGEIPGAGLRDPPGRQSASDSALMDALREHNATLKADVEQLEAQLRVEADRLTAAEARVETLVAEPADRCGPLAARTVAPLAAASRAA